MLTPEQLEQSLLASIQSQQDLTWLLREGVTEESFILFGPVFTYLREYAQEYDGRLPKREDLISLFSEEGLALEEPGDLHFYADELLKADAAKRAQIAVLERFGKQGVNLAEDPDETIRQLAEDLRKLRRSDTRNIAYLDREALLRGGWLDERMAAAKENRVLGIPTGLTCFDNTLQGWQPGEAVMVMGPKGVGKSWVLMKFACVAYRHGYKVLFISPEMSWEECALRFDVVFAAHVGERFSHSALLAGQLDNAKEYKAWLKTLTKREGFICVDSADIGAFTLESILALQDEHRPDLLVLDGIHLIGGNEGSSGWERIKKAADGLKAAAQHYKSTVIWGSQVDKESMRNPTEPATTGASAAYGKSAVEAANRLITLATYAGDQKRRVFKVPNNRSGMEFHVKQHLIFDVDIGVIEQVEAEVPQDFGDEVVL